MQAEYKNRGRRLIESDIYSPFNPSYLFMLQQRQRAVISMLKRKGIDDLSNLRILEVGCGQGGVLSEYLRLGANPEMLTGVDLLEKRLRQARRRLPNSRLALADGALLPFPSNSFDLVLQYTAISSVLDASTRQMILTNMYRVLKPDGLILSYDFWLNPTNKQTRGLRMDEIRASLPTCKINYRTITLAPPIARRIVPISWWLGIFLENLVLLNTHHLVAIRPVGKSLTMKNQTLHN